MPVAAGIIIAIGDTSLEITDDFVLSGIALGTIVTVVGYHLARAVAPANLREDVNLITVEREGVYEEPRIPGSHEADGPRRSS